MSLFDAFKGKKSAVLVLTPQGKTTVEGQAHPNIPDNKFRVLSSINENGPSTVNQIADDITMDRDNVKGLAQNLIATGYLRKSSASE